MNKENRQVQFSQLRFPGGQNAHLARSLTSLIPRQTVTIFQTDSRSLAPVSRRRGYCALP